MILTGAGPVFCAGFDRSEFEGGAMAEVFAEAVDYHHRVYNFSKPLVAAVKGSTSAAGGGTFFFGSATAVGESERRKARVSAATGKSFINLLRIEARPDS